MELKNSLAKPYTDKDRLNFIVEYNHQKGFEIRETEEALEAWGKDDQEIIADKMIRVKAVRNQYLIDTDKYMIDDFPISAEDKAKYKDYRAYLRAYPQSINWFEKEPLSFDEWKKEVE